MGLGLSENNDACDLSSPPAQLRQVRCAASGRQSLDFRPRTQIRQQVHQQRVDAIWLVDARLSARLEYKHNAMIACWILPSGSCPVG